MHAIVHSCTRFFLMVVRVSLGVPGSLHVLVVLLKPQAGLTPDASTPRPKSPTSLNLKLQTQELKPQAVGDPFGWGGMQALSLACFCSPLSLLHLH